MENGISIHLYYTPKRGGVNRKFTFSPTKIYKNPPEGGEKKPAQQGFFPPLCGEKGAKYRIWCTIWLFRGLT
jgi:hypothetical protein